MKEIELSNGKAYIRDFITRKTEREHNDTLYDGVKGKASMDKEGNLELGDFPIVNVDHTVDTLVQNLVEKLEINGASVTVTPEVLDNMKGEDFALISKECQAVFKAYNKAKAAKKKS